MRKLVSVLLTLAVVLGLSLTMAVPAAAADPTTVASSTMIFNGSLTYDPATGAFNGTIAMVNESATGLGDKIAGFDVYARDGAKATYDTVGSGENYACGAVAGHDAYNTGGGWGSWYDPDCADWNHYQLNFSENSWAVEYYNGGVTYAAPMSGTMDWNAMYAAETGAGAYYTGYTGVAENASYALNNPCTGVNDGSAAWDMDWTWGSEYIPLQFPGFDVKVSGSGGSYTVTLTPAARSSTVLTVDVPDIVAISVDPTSIDFGTLLPGQTSDVFNIAVDNIGTHKVDVDADVSGSAGDLFFDNLAMRLDSSGGGSTGPWSGIITNLAMDGSTYVQTWLPVPSDYTPSGTETATLIFTATGV